jgi:hypothetical protein
MPANKALVDLADLLLNPPRELQELFDACDPALRHEERESE